MFTGLQWYPFILIAFHAIAIATLPTIHIVEGRELDDK
jgi:hypothetical protein